MTSISIQTNPKPLTPVLAVGILYLAGVVFALAGPAPEQIGWAVLMAILLISPAVEEIVFRLGLWDWVEGLAGRRTALLATSLAFGAAHQILQPGIAMGMPLVVFSLMGAIFGLARVMGGVALAIVTHGACNAFLFMLPVSSRQGLLSWAGLG